MPDSVYTAPDDELGILGACLLGGLDTAAEAIATANPDWIISDPVRESLAVVGSLVAAGHQPTLEAVRRGWKEAHGGRPAPIEVWSQALEACPSEANLAFHIDGVRQAASRRRLRDAASALAADAANPVRTPEETIARLEANIAPDRDGMPKSASGKEAFLRLIEDAEERQRRGGQLSGVTTGIRELDEATEGFQPGELFLVGARPSVGKTAMGVSMLASCCIEGGVPAMFVTAEMSTVSIMRRLVATVGSVPMGAMKAGRLEPSQFQAMTVAGGRIKKAPMHILDVSGDPNVSSVVAAIRRDVRRHGVRVAIVDYMQKLRPGEKQDKRHLEVADVSRRLKAVAASTGITVVALAQLNRDAEKEKGRKPRLSDLRESGDIEQDADVVTLIHRERDATDGKASLIIAKQRDGQCGEIPLYFEGQFCRFTQGHRTQEDDV